MNFIDYGVIKVSKQGTRYVKDNVIIGNRKKPCYTCGKRTKFVEVLSEQHFCSDECVDKLYREVARLEQVGGVL